MEVPRATLSFYRMRTPRAPPQPKRATPPCGHTGGLPDWPGIAGAACDFKLPARKGPGCPRFNYHRPIAQCPRWPAPVRGSRGGGRAVAGRLKENNQTGAHQRHISAALAPSVAVDRCAPTCTAHIIILAILLLSNSDADGSILMHAHMQPQIKAMTRGVVTMPMLSLAMAAWVAAAVP